MPVLENLLGTLSLNAEGLAQLKSHLESIDQEQATKLAITAVPIALAAIPAYTAAKFAYNIAKAKSIESQLISGPTPMPYDKDSWHPLWGVGQLFSEKSPTRALGYLHDKLGPVVVWRALHRVSLSIADPKLAQLVIGKLNLPKNDYESVKELLGESVLTSNGAEWHRKRKAVNPAFKVSFLKEVLAPAVVDRTNVMFDVLFPKAPEGVPMNLMEAFSKITLDVIGLAGFDYDFGFASSATFDEGLSAMVLNVLEEPNLRSVNPLRKYYKVREAMQYSRDLANFKALSRKVIREARARQARNPDSVKPTSIIGLLLQQSDLTDEELLNEVNTFLFAGHETSASTLSFMFIALDAYPDAKAKLIAEIDEVLGGRDPTFEDLSKFKYLTAVMKETLRFFPIGWATARITTETTQLGDYSIPPNTPILVDYVALHRNPAVWDRPLEFLPERFLNTSSSGDGPSDTLDEKATGSTPYSYLPFSGGNRICAGKSFAEIEIKLLMAMMVQKYQWKVQRPESWKDRPFHDLYKDGTTLRPLPHMVWIAPRH
ncbi:cytochrome P450 [Catenaria anguillulae PL171]|uniref:Cytochrome P450 n=1 Tax=Catenaria anguillulae PL171 TaxID=765915 RepID=A0A1Y2HZ15_9FUNG|nr:cytochrome P450 [Catenaria anguillulae PL171]